MDTPFLTQETTNLMTEENLLKMDPLSYKIRKKKDLDIKYLNYLLRINSINTISYNTTNFNTTTSKNKQNKFIFDNKMHTSTNVSLIII